MKPSEERRHRKASEIQALSDQILQFGLELQVHEVPLHMRNLAQKVAKDCLEEGWSFSDLMWAARSGMETLWPFSEGRPWSPVDFKSNCAKAVAAGRKDMATHNRGRSALKWERKRMEERRAAHNEA